MILHLMEKWFFSCVDQFALCRGDLYLFIYLFQFLTFMSLLSELKSSSSFFSPIWSVGTAVNSTKLWHLDIASQCRNHFLPSHLSLFPVTWHHLQPTYYWCESFSISQFNSKLILSPKPFLIQNQFLIQHIRGLISESTSVCFARQSDKLWHESKVCKKLWSFFTN